MVMDCFLPNTNRAEVDENSIRLVTQFLKVTNEGKYCDAAIFVGLGSSDVIPPTKKDSGERREDVETLTPPTKNPPVHLSNLKKRTPKPRGGSCGRKAHLRSQSVSLKEWYDLCDVVISLSKEKDEAKENGLLGRGRTNTKMLSVEANRA
ncbi:hypothetical protein FF1_007732 [Malus domestica]